MPPQIVPTTNDIKQLLFNQCELFAHDNDYDLETFEDSDYDSDYYNDGRKEYTVKKLIYKPCIGDHLKGNKFTYEKPRKLITYSEHNENDIPSDDSCYDSEASIDAIETKYNVSSNGWGGNRLIIYTTSTYYALIIAPTTCGTYKSYERGDGYISYSRSFESLIKYCLTDNIRYLWEKTEEYKLYNNMCEMTKILHTLRFDKCLINLIIGYYTDLFTL